MCTESEFKGKGVVQADVQSQPYRITCNRSRVTHNVQPALNLELVHRINTKE